MYVFGHRIFSLFFTLSERVSASSLKRLSLSVPKVKDDFLKKSRLLFGYYLKCLFLICLEGRVSITLFLMR